MGSRLMCALVFGSVCAGPLPAQVTAVLSARTPMPAEISVWERDRTLIQLVVTNPGNVSYQGAAVSYTVTDQSAGRLVARSKDGDPDLPRFTIPAGGTVVLFGPDIVSQAASEVEGDYETVARTTNSLPEGEFEICVRILAPTGQEIPATGNLCARFLVVIPDPPTLILPEDDAELPFGIRPTFTWTPIIGAPGLTPHYRLVIAPAYRHQADRDALEQNTALLDQIFTSASVYYAPAYPQFELYPDAAGFVWQVQALDPEGRPAGRNQGRSEIFRFSFESAAPDSSISDSTHRAR